MSTTELSNNIEDDVASSSAPAPFANAFFPMMPFKEQEGEVFVGPSAKDDAMIIGLGLSKLNPQEKQDLQQSKNFARQQSIQFLLKKRQLEHQERQQKINQYTQALSKMSRLYVGSISAEVHEETLKQLFEAYGPVKELHMSIDMNTGSRRGFAFIDFEVPEAAILAMKYMDGQSVGTRTLAIKPTTDMDYFKPVVDKIMEEAKNSTRIYVASINSVISESDLKTIFGSFGEILSVQLPKHLTGQGHRGFAYIEFKNSDSAKSTITGMIGFNLGGQVLQVGNCITPPEFLKMMIPSASNLSSSFL